MQIRRPPAIVLVLACLCWSSVPMPAVCSPLYRRIGQLLLDSHADAGLLSALGDVETRRAPDLPADPPVTVREDPSLPSRSPALPLSHPRIVRRVAGIQPEQIQVVYYKESAVKIAWVTGEPQMAPQVTPSFPQGIKSIVQYGKSSDNLKHQAEGKQKVYTQVYDGFKGALSYASGVIHHAKLKHLKPGHTYFYRCGDPEFPGQWSDVLNFTMPRATGRHEFPFRLGVIADIGQTYNSTVTLDHLITNEPELVILVGDLTYADDHLLNDTSTVDFDGDWDGPAVTYQPRWDTFGRFIQPLASRVPLMTTSGNHEIETQSDGTTFAAYTTRYPVPHKSSGSSSHLWYSFDVAGMHVIVLTPYDDFDKGSHQYNWLKKDLADNFDRSKTPWLVVAFHAPWYNSVVAHYQENECMRLSMEHLLYEYGADIVLQGHVHSYERMNPVYDYKLDPCGPVYLNVGDGGNIEGLYKEYVDDPGMCPDPKSGQCVTKVDGHYCPESQPAWSAYREASFGHGTLDFVNSTHALWRWHRNQDGAAVTKDEVFIVRDAEQCSNRRPVTVPREGVE